MRREQTEMIPHAVTGQLTFLDTLLYVLIDCGVTHSFVSRGVIKRLGLTPSVAERSISIDIPDVGVIVSDLILVDQEVIIIGRVLRIDLIMLELADFDMILGMDFLSCYGAEIDCKRKNVKLQLGSDQFTFG